MQCEFSAEADQLKAPGAEASQSKYMVRTQETLVQLFRFLQAKEIFIQTYVEYMSERLLNGLSRDGPAREMEIASLFKLECGDQFRKQTEQMVADVTQRSDLSERFRASSKKIKTGQSFSFLILDSTKWPLKNAEHIVLLPKEIKDIYEESTQMYEKSKRGTTNNKH